MWRQGRVSGKAMPEELWKAAAKLARRHSVFAVSQSLGLEFNKLSGPVKWTYYYLYVVIDVFSRLVVGWMVAPRESAELAKRLLEESYHKHHIEPNGLTIHSDRGSSMSSKAVALLLADLGVTKSHSRPGVSNDNPFSESHFKTLKYSSEFPQNFASIEEARAFSNGFFEWYNHEHHHSGLLLLTPAQVHLGLAEEVLEQRHRLVLEAFKAHPERFVRGAPIKPTLPKEVFINRPELQPRLLPSLQPVALQLPADSLPTPSEAMG